MEITLSLRSIADEAARLIMRAAVGVDLDPLKQMRAIPTDIDTISRTATAVRASVVGLLGCYYEDMQIRADSLKLTLWNPAWLKRVDAASVKELALRLMALAVAEQLLAPVQQLSPVAAVYRSQATDAGLQLVRLLDTIALPPTPPPGRVRRPLHPF